MAGIFSAMRGGEENNSFGVNRYQQRIQEESPDNIVTVDEVADGFKKLILKEIPAGAMGALREIKRGLTPGFVNRLNTKKIHAQVVENNERAIGALQDDVSITRQREMAKRKQDKLNFKLLKEMLNSKKHMKEEVKKAKVEAEGVKVRNEQEEYQARRELQLKELNARLEGERRAMEEQAERDAVALRQFRISHFGEEAVGKRVEYEMLMASKSEAARNQAILDRTFNEWEDRDIARTRMQADIPPETEPIGIGKDKLGIFGIPMGPGAFRGIGVDSGFKQGLDEYEIHPLSAEPNTAYEDLQVGHLYIETEKKEQQALYDALQLDCQSLETALEHMCEMRDALERDQRQVSQELLAIENEQLGPPRRLSLPHEIPAVHVWKNRSAHIQKKLNDLQYAIDKADGKKRSAEAQALGVAQKIAGLSEKEKKAKAKVDDFNGELGMLPMVVGRSLDKVPGMGQELALPKETMDAVTHKSRLVGYRDEAGRAKKLLKESDGLDQQIWMNRLYEDNKKMDVERVLNRLSDMADRLTKSKTEAARVNIIDSLKAFLASGHELNKVNSKHVGLLPWYLHHDPEVSSGIRRHFSENPLGEISFDTEKREMEADDVQKEEEEEEEREGGRINVDIGSASAGAGAGGKMSGEKGFVEEAEDATAKKERARKQALSNGVTLAHKRSGTCGGVIMLPKNTVWMVVVTITRQGHLPENENLDPSDFISVKMGPSLTSLSHIGTYFNTVNPLTGTVLYDVKYMFRGKSFAFRFDFSSSSEDSARHLVVCTGLYEEYELDALEVVNDPKLSGRQRVLSSYVKMLRVEESRGKLRETRLLEELIAVEGNENMAVWDSEIITQYRQRYSREYFARILRAEVLLQQQVSAARRKVKEQLPSTDAEKNAVLADADLDAEAKLEQSKKKYTMKKRATQRKLIDEGKDLVGKRVIIFDETLRRWRNVTVLDCYVKWIDNGLVAKVTHLVQEYDDGHNKLGQEMLINLRSFKFFLSPHQKVDKETIARWREKKRWEESLVQISENADDVAKKLKSSYETFRKREEKSYRKLKRRVEDRFENNITADADKVAKSPAGRRAIKALLDDVFLDIKKGLVRINPEKSVQKQAMAVAKSRFIDDHIRSKRSSMVDELARKQVEVHEAVITRSQEVDALQKRVLADALAEKRNLQTQIRLHMQRRKTALLERVKFPPEEFRKAAPIAYSCEHLRTKAWGDNYGKGVRCLVCGKELSKIETEESQQLGYGSGYSAELYEAVKRHRENEESFRFESSAQLAVVENERLRLEKERRVMDLGECYFYDFQDLEVIYDFDRRHQREIKAAGVFRQGLQWTEEELKAYEFTKMVREKERLIENRLPETLLDEYDPLQELTAPPPTFRAADERRKAQQKELVYQIGRLHNFRKKINGYKYVRIGLLKEQKLYALVLEKLHKESYSFDDQLQSIEMDLDRTTRLLATYESMQILWAQATAIQNQAKRDKMKADMKRVGVWDDVKEQYDKVSFLKDETKELLKSKLLLDAKLLDAEKSVEFRSTIHKKAVKKFVKAEKTSRYLQYCRPGNLIYTRFGQCFVISYRQTDDMLLVNLPFGNPPAKAWLHYKDVVDSEVCRQRAEVLLMEWEDSAMQSYTAKERIRLKKERYQMQREEEGMRRLWQFFDLGKHEDKTMHESITQVVDERFDVTESKAFKKLQRTLITPMLKKAKQDAAHKRKMYKGPPSGKPKALSFWQMHKQRRLIEIELKTKFIEEGATKVEQATKRNLYDVRARWVQNYSFEQLIDSVIKEMIAQVASEAYTEGRVAKGFAEKKSGVVFPHPTWMQFGTYSSLAAIWRARKEELKAKIEINKGKSSKALAAAAASKPAVSKDSLSVKELQNIKQQRKLMKLEKERQAEMCENMRKEEVLVRDFYRWEMKENLRERRLMREEERDMRQLMKEEEKQRQEAEAAMLYRQGGGVRGGGGRAGDGDGGAADRTMTYERRRQELKELTLERRRRAEDQARMMLEDEDGKLLREIDRVERQKKKFAEEFGEDDEDEEEGGGHRDGGISAEEKAKRELEKMIEGLTDDQMKKMELEVPEWLVPPLPFPTWDNYKQNKYIQMMVRIRRKQLRAQRLAERDAKRLQRLEEKSYAEWAGRFAVVEQEELEMELGMMEAEEEKKEADARLDDVKNNMMKILIYCRDKGEEELRARTELKRKQEIARKRDQELKDAEEWLELCMQRSKNRDKLKRRVVSDCKWVDTESINGFHQRFATERLRARLYMTYFRQIISSMINRAEVIATERKLMKYQEDLSMNMHNLTERTTAMKGLLHEIRRDEYMRMRRSFLNEKLFGRSRRRVLQQRFGGWVRYYLWNRGHKEAYQLKYEVIKRQLDIDRQFKRQLLTKKDAQNKNMNNNGSKPDGEIAGDGDVSSGESMLVPYNGGIKSRTPTSSLRPTTATGSGTSSKDSSKYQTLMQKHRERPIQCKDCFRFYLESQNVSTACSYHADKFVLECPITCPNPGLTMLCIAHRKLRWRCCNATNKDAPGCSRKHHAPPDVDPVYDKIMNNINERDRAYLAELEDKVGEARRNNYEGQLHEAKTGKRIQMEDQLMRDRATAQRFSSLKFV